MNERTRLERAALAAHRRGDDWAQFWPGVADAVRLAEPWDNAAYHRLIRRLSHLLTCGDTAGMVPPANGWSEPMPWEIDDAAASAPILSPSDSETSARIDWQRAGVQSVFSFGG